MKAAEVWTRAIDEYGAGREQLPPGTPRPDRRQLGPLRAGPDAAGRQEAHRRFPLPQRQQGRPSRPTPSTSPSCSTTSRLISRAAPTSSTGTRSTSATSATASSNSSRTQYLGDKVAELGPWISSPAPPTSMTASPSRRRSTKPGAYLVTAQDGRTATRAGSSSGSADTVIVKKQLEDQTLLLRRRRRHRPAGRQGRPRVLRLAAGADPAQRQPVPDADHRSSPTLRTAMASHRSARTSMPTAIQWLITARQKERWSGTLRLPRLHRTSGTASSYDPEYNADQASSPSPIARSIGPSRTCSSSSGSGMPSTISPTSPISPGRRSHVVITIPRREKVFEKDMTADEYGGMAGEYFLPHGATLGVYSIGLTKPGDLTVQAARTSASRNTRSPNSR